MIKVKYHLPISAAVMLMGILLFQGWQLTTLLQQREWEYSDNLLHNLSVRAQASLGRRFEAEDLVAVRQSMSEIYLFKRETEAYLIDENNRIIAADRLGFDGDQIDSLAITIDQARLRKARTSLEVDIVADRRRKDLVAYIPISMARAGEKPFSKTGTLLIHLNVTQGLDEVSSFVVESVLRSLFIILLLVGTITVILHFLWTRRVTSILDVANAYKQGNLAARNTHIWRDEIGQISLAFNQIADAVAERQLLLEASQSNLKQLNATLEARVRDRTALLQASEQELQSVLDLAPDGIVVITGKGIIRKFNEAAVRITGWSEEDVLNRNINFLMPEPHSSQHDGYLKSYSETRIAKIIGTEREAQALRKDGSLCDIALSISAVTLKGAEHYIGIIRDISDRKVAEEALAKAQQGLVEAEKMAALGGLVAGVAHEINTPVGVGVTAISHLGLEVQRFQEQYVAGQMKRSDLERLVVTATESIQIIETNLMRAAQLIRSFKEIAVDQAGDDEREINLLDYVGRVLTSLGPKLKQRPIVIECEVEPVDLLVRIQPGGLWQIVTNLVMNSLAHGFDAADRGQIRITAERLPKGFQLVYRDSGKGMSAETVERIFEPFFTTKRGSGGSGLGMHIVYNIVTQKYGGSIRCESVPGKGACFIMTFPTAQTATPEDKSL
ncbi:MAG: hypothetical protein RLZZ561_1994 [Pseudomonadota bacterium]|jgi:PAS domain S-box-containing protein